MLPGDRSDLRHIEPDGGGNPCGRVHDEQCVQYTHEMPYDLKEASGRVIIRLVPLLYGFMFGDLSDNTAVAMSIGVLVSTALDLGMGDKSLFLGMFRLLLRSGCPVIAMLAHTLAWGIRGIGLQVPGILSNMRCGAS